jgi:FkbM family methyltransferase
MAGGAVVSRGDLQALRIVWQSSAPWTPFGYGVTTRDVVPRLHDRLGHEVAISAYYGLDTGKLNWRGIDVFCRGMDGRGNDIAAANAKQFGADILISHQDTWGMNPTQITANGTRWVAWNPLDSEPIAPQIAIRLKECYQAIALSRFGQQQAALAGLDLPLVPQGVDTNAFTPGDRREARERLGWPQDAFIFGMIAHNKGYPSRKAYPQQLEAFSQFAKKHSDAMIYLHCYGEPELDPEAPPIVWHLERYGLQDRAIWAQPYDLNLGYSTEAMVDRYRAFDVLLSVSMSEGFGIPLIESQACGTPVITGAWTAMEENCYAGWLVAKEDSEPFFVSPLECEWRYPHIGAIVEQMEVAYDCLTDDFSRRRLANRARREVIANNDQDMLIDTRWKPVLEDIARRIEEETVPYHRHQWASYGHQNGRGVIVPCLVPDCPAERLLDGDKGIVAPAGLPLVIDGITLDIEDDPNGGVKHAIATEIVTTYRLQDLTFEPGDVVIDVGAHVGIVSCYLAKKWPGIQVYAFEPVTANHERLCRNVQANRLENVTVFNRAITSDGRDIELSGDPAVNTGHYSAYAERGRAMLVCGSIAAPLLFEWVNHSIALLKLDCEGAEYEILYGMGEKLSQVDRLVMEVHENNRLLFEHGGGARLVEYAKRSAGHVRASIIPIPDAEEVPV